MEKKAGCGDYERKIPFQRETGRRQTRTEADWIRILEWADRVIVKKAFKVWEPFSHPRLGEVEIGVWRRKFTLINPPPGMMAAEIANDITFALEIARRLPRVRVLSCRIDGREGGESVMTAEIGNTGFFPTCLTERAVRLGKADPVRAELVIESGGEPRENSVKDLGHLEGSWSHGRPSDRPSRRSVNWRVGITDPGSLRVSVRAVFSE